MQVKILLLVSELFMKNSKKNILFIIALLIALIGVFSSIFFIREIFSGIKSADSLKKEIGASEIIDLSVEKAVKDISETKEVVRTLDQLFVDSNSLKDKLDKIKNDLNLVKNSFDFVPVVNQNSENFVFSGKSTGKFSEVTRQLQIIENHIYPIKILKVDLVKSNGNSQDLWVLFFEAEFLTNKIYE